VALPALRNLNPGREAKLPAKPRVLDGIPLTETQKVGNGQSAFPKVKRAARPAKKTNASKAVTAGAAKHFASIFPGPSTPLPDDLGAALGKLASTLQVPLWLVIQNHEGPFGHLEENLFEAFHAAKGSLPVGTPIALLVDSPGGDARAAYQVSRLLQRRCGTYTAIVAKEAMSAATLLVLGSVKPVMAPEASIGPLDVQIYDSDAEHGQSALDEVQALDRLREYALDSLDNLMLHLLVRTNKKVESVLPHALRASVDMMRPLLEKIDVVHYNERSRLLKVGEEYARRLLAPQYPDRPAHADEVTALTIAAALVANYPEHPFPIDREEAAKIGLQTEGPSLEQAPILEELWMLVGKSSAIGRFS
jgi:Serine dehydrogenase proteinase